MDKSTTQKIKGIAICLMVFHHLFITDWHVTSAPSVPYYLSAIAHTCKICVAIYCFLTGYGYAFAKNKNLSYSAKKCAALLKYYWLQLVLIFIPVAVINGYEMTPRLLVCNLFGLSPNLNFFAWYVYFYIFAMLLLPLCARLMPGKSWLCGIMVVLGCNMSGVLLHSLPEYGENIIITDLFNCVMYFPGVIFGYLCARYRVFEWLDKRLPKSVWWYILGAVVVVLCRTIISSFMGLSLDIYYAPAFIYCCYRTIRNDNFRYVGKLMSICGKYSTQIWFFHAVFFSTYIRDYCQWILWLPRNPILVFIWCMSLCFAAAVMMERLVIGLDALLSRIKKVRINA